MMGFVKNPKLILLTILAVGGVIFAWTRISGGKGARVLEELDDRPVPYKCLDCGEKFGLTWNQLKELRKDGKTLIPDNELERVECAECGKVTATEWYPTGDEEEEPGSTSP